MVEMPPWQVFFARPAGTLDFLERFSTLAWECLKMHQGELVEVDMERELYGSV